MVKTATDTPFGGIFKQKYPEVFQFSVKNSLKNATTFAKKRADFERILSQKLNEKRFKNVQKTIAFLIGFLTVFLTESLTETTPREAAPNRPSATR
jgi:hypothetical protein